ncbi:MAG: outer membrane lipoprotein carrier protein LolA [Paludibacter sp.]|nr:outer membrane lipoprotein carrier protein LolA [Paludibacter sp.]
MKKISFIITISILLISNILNGQTATKIIDNLILQAKTNAISTDFTLTVKEKNSKQGQTIKGNFTMKSNKFIMKMNEMVVYFNGKTQWAYSSENKEVTITEPTSEELAQINPMAVLYSYRETFDIKFAANNSNSANYVIEMTPKTKISDLDKMIVTIEKTTGNLLSIMQTEKNGNALTLTLSNYQSKIAIADSAFVFDIKKNKNVSVNDLR